MFGRDGHDRTSMRHVKRSYVTVRKISRSKNEGDLVYPRGGS